MKTAILAALSAVALMAQSTPPAPAAPAVKLWRLDCGTVQVNSLNAFSDTYAYPGQSKRLTASCYLIKHGDTYMLWDAGLPAALKGAATDPKPAMSPTLATTLPEQFARIAVAPSAITILGISHYHFDHIGQAPSFSGATLMIGKGDHDALKAGQPGVDGGPLKSWLTGGGKVDPVNGDKDVFGDGSVVMLGMPGHTPGHHALLVKLPRTGLVMLTGDLAHFTENYDGDGVPPFNTDRADTLASLARFKAVARNLKARVIIQHEPRDVAKLPAFPAAAD
ncbi:N-acyl homoserine lactonase family protein [uncultured Sphingomonas sp.]|uniref:N-acyl homoserine lactonase family protein n=1 Tax=uncultured Sphingomonas sp. TaxID=158754 RepID=UPI0035CAE526